MKNQIVVLGMLTVSAMLLSLGSGVNESSQVPKWNGSPVVADGVPMPTPKPPKTNAVSPVVLADGVPMPTPKPPKTQLVEGIIVADGVPMPTPKPPKGGWAI